MKRLLILLLLFLPVLVLGGWLLSQQLPALLAPQWWWIPSDGPNGAPAACEAATSLRLYGGERTLFEQPAVSADDAIAVADRFIAEHYGDSEMFTPDERSDPALFRVTLDGERRLVWLYTALISVSSVSDLPGTNMPGAAAVIYIDATTGEPLTLFSAVGTGTAAETCPFPLRDWAVAAARSTPFVAFAGYMGLLLAIGLLFLLYRLFRKMRPLP